MSEITEQVGQMIKEARKAKGLTQKELGEKLGVGVSVINRYEKGKQNLTLDTLYKVLQVMGKTLIIDAK